MYYIIKIFEGIFSKKPLSLTKDPIWELFLRIAVPSSIGTVFMTLYNVVDTFFAGKISANALAALAQTFPVYFIIIALGVGLSIGTTSFIANSIGEKDNRKASYFLAQSIILSIIVALIVTITGIYLGPHIIFLMNKSLVTLNLSMDYLNIIFLGSILIFLQMCFNSSLSAMGDTKSNMKVLIFTFFLNIFLNPLFIFGYGIIPAMGIKGIALSTVVCQFFGALYIIYKTSKTYLIDYLYPKSFLPKFEIIKDLLFQGIPASIGMMMISIGFFIILFFIGQYGDLAIAGYGTAIRYEQLYLLPILGLNTAVLSMVGQNFGAKKMQRINKIYNNALLFACTLMFFSGFVIFFTAETAINLFTNNQDVINYGTTYLKIAALIAPVYPIFFISNALIQGFKKASIVMFLSMFRMVILPIITLWFLIFYLKSSFAFVFWGLLIINWIFGIFLFFFTKSFIIKESIKIKFKEQNI